MTTLHMETEVVRGLASQIKQKAIDFRSQGQSFTQSAQAADWSGPNRDELINEVEDLLRLINAQAGAAEVLSDRLEREVAEWEEVENKYSTGFKEVSQKIMAIQIPIVSVSSQLEKLLLETEEKCYQKGQVYIANVDPYKIPNYLYQKGNNCALYSLFQLLYMNGIVVDEAQMNTIIEKYRRFWPEPLAFHPSVQSWILDELGIKYKTDGLSGFFHFFDDSTSGHLKGMFYDATSIKDNLIESLKQGKPVAVGTGSEIFGVEGGHGFTVLGANVDKDGNLLSVVVNTNMGIPHDNPTGPDIRTIDGADFISAWVEKSAYMLTIDK